MPLIREVEVEISAEELGRLIKSVPNLKNIPYDCHLEGIHQDRLEQGQPATYRAVFRYQPPREEDIGRPIIVDENGEPATFMHMPGGGRRPIPGGSDHSR